VLQNHLVTFGCKDVQCYSNVGCARRFTGKGQKAAHTLLAVIDLLAPPNFGCHNRKLLDSLVEVDKISSIFQPNVLIHKYLFNISCVFGWNIGEVFDIQECTEWKYFKMPLM